MSGDSLPLAADLRKKLDEGKSLHALKELAGLELEIRRASALGFSEIKVFAIDEANQNLLKDKGYGIEYYSPPQWDAPCGRPFYTISW